MLGSKQQNRLGHLVPHHLDHRDNLLHSAVQKLVHPQRHQQHPLVLQLELLSASELPVRLPQHKPLAVEQWHSRQLLAVQQKLSRQCLAVQ